MILTIKSEMQSITHVRFRQWLGDAIIRLRALVGRWFLVPLLKRVRLGTRYLKTPKADRLSCNNTRRWHAGTVHAVVSMRWSYAVWR